MDLLAIGRSVFDLLFPKRCLHCDAIVSTDLPLCISCLSELPFTHYQFSRENLVYEKLKPLCDLEYSASLLFFRHDNVTQKLLHYLKYHGRKEIGVLLAEKLIQEMEMPDFDGIIPVPIHPKKLKKRGYNQVVPFAQTLSDKTQIPMVEEVLVRVENNLSQVSKKRTERLSSIRHAFALKENLAEGHYLLIDDLITTGATLSICVNLLLAQPNVKISVLTIGVAG